MLAMLISRCHRFDINLINILLSYAANLMFHCHGAPNLIFKYVSTQLNDLSFIP